MRTDFDNFFIEERYKHVSKLGDRLERVEKLIDWEGRSSPGSATTEVRREEYEVQTEFELIENLLEQARRPNIDEIVMLKVLVLQNWYSLSDEEMEFQIADRLSFQQ